MLALVQALALELRRERSKALGRLQPGVEAESLPSRADDEYQMNTTVVLSDSQL